MTTRSLDNTPTTIRVAVHDLFLIAPCNDDVMCQREPEALYAALISAICSTLHRCGSESQPTTLETCADLPLLCAAAVITTLHTALPYVKPCASLLIGNCIGRRHSGLQSAAAAAAAAALQLINNNVIRLPVVTLAELSLSWAACSYRRLVVSTATD